MIPPMQLPGQVLLICLLAGLVLAAALARFRIARRRDKAKAGTDEAGNPPPLPEGWLQRELSLAAEHVNSIRLLLEIARQHHQPVPNAAITNLEMVGKQLGEILRRLGAAGEVTAPEHRPQAASPPRPRQPYAGCRASPSDK